MTGTQTSIGINAVKIYSLGDFMENSEAERLEIDRWAGHAFQYKNIGAIRTGDFREPKKGEWFLSGARPCAYKAPNDLSEKYHIAELVKYKTIEIKGIVKRINNNQKEEA